MPLPISMTLSDIVDHSPLITDPKFGREPCMRRCVFLYYREHFVEPKAMELTDQYFAKLAEETGIY